MLPLDRWFAVQVRTSRESSITELLSHKGYEIFLPKYTHDQGLEHHTTKQVLFPGYLFCRFTTTIVSPLLTTPGVIRIVGMGRVPCAVDDAEIEAIHLMLRSGLPLEPHTFVAAGERIQIVSGPLRGLEGFFVSSKGRGKAVVSVMLLQRSVSVKVSDGTFVPLRPNRPNTSHTVLGAALTSASVISLPMTSSSS